MDRPKLIRGWLKILRLMQAPQDISIDSGLDRILIWPALSLLLLVIVIFHQAAPVNHDVALIIEGANRLLDGGHFGRDIVDVNPPLAWWITAIPVAFARISGSGAAATFTLFAALLALVSIAIVNAILSQERLPAQGRLYPLLFTGAILLVAPGYDYGQREHLMLIAALPYLVAASVRVRGGHITRPLATFAGLISAVGFCLKPHFLLVPLFIELWMAFKTRGILRCIRVETVILGVVAVGYVWAILIFAPDYLFSVIPDAIIGYWAYASPFPDVMTRSVLALLPSFITAVLLYRCFGSGSSLVQVMFLASTGAFLSSLLQAKGWSYHLFPAIAFAGIGCAYLYDVQNGIERRRLMASAAFFVLTITNFSHAVQYTIQVVSGRGTVERVERLATVFQEYAGEGGSIFAFITSARDIFPAVLASNTRWASSIPTMYLLVAEFRANEVEPDKAIQVREAAKRQLAEVISQISVERPAVIVIDVNRNKLGFGNLPFDYLAYLSQNPSFVDFWKVYTERDPIDGFRVFVRIPQPRERR